MQVAGYVGETVALHEPVEAVPRSSTFIGRPSVVLELFFFGEIVLAIRKPKNIYRSRPHTTSVRRSISLIRSHLTSIFGLLGLRVLLGQLRSHTRVKVLLE